jgi:hypothetical protein
MDTGLLGQSRTQGNGSKIIRKAKPLLNSLVSPEHRLGCLRGAMPLSKNSVPLSILGEGLNTMGSYIY